MAIFKTGSGESGNRGIRDRGILESGNPGSETIFSHMKIISFVQIVDLHLRTKADLYSFMQCSFVKIQDLIGYVGEYMLMQPMKQLMYADYLL